jgi:hypothetical protein
MKESRLEFAQEWHERGLQSLKEDKPFESFIYNWLALTIAAKTYKSFNVRSSKDGTNSDKEDILFWINSDAELVMSIMQKYNEDMRVLSERSGVELKETIIDVKESNQKEFILEKHQEFSGYWLSETRHKHARKKDINNTLIYILNRIRNNLFHGNKSYNLQSDRELLETVCPILNDLTDNCIKVLVSMIR